MQSPTRDKRLKTEGQKSTRRQQLQKNNDALNVVKEKEKSSLFISICIENRKIYLILQGNPFFSSKLTLDGIIR
jgi:hypothetical protein